MADLEMKLEIRDSTQKKRWTYYVVQMTAVLARSNIQNPTCGHSEVATCNRTAGIAAQFRAQQQWHRHQRSRDNSRTQSLARQVKEVGVTGCLQARAPDPGTLTTRV